MMDPYIIVIGMSGFGGAVIGFIVFSMFNRLFISRKMSDRVLLSQISQEEAEELLKKKGFRILAKQKRADIITYIDGKPNLGYVQADFLVEKNKKTYVAEVKAGEMVADPTEPSTRRQLMEYKFAYKPDGLLLVDMTDRSIHLVDFENPSYGDERFFKLILLSLVVIIVACVLWIFLSIKIL
jgi:hypothetical protein